MPDEYINMSSLKTFVNTKESRIKVISIIETELMDRGYDSFKKNIIGEYILSEKKMLLEDGLKNFDMIEYPFSMKEIIELVYIKNLNKNENKNISDIATDLFKMLSNGTIIKYIIPKGVVVFSKENIYKSFILNPPYKCSIDKFYNEYSSYFSERLTRKYNDWKKELLSVHPELEERSSENGRQRNNAN